MGFFSSSKTTNRSYTTTNTTFKPTTNIDVDNEIDLEPLAQVLAESQQKSAQTIKESALIELKNSALNREALDGYLEKAKNGFVLILIGGVALYMYKNSKKRKKRK